MNNLEEDLRTSKLSKDEASALRVNAFQFQFVDKGDKALCTEIRKFVERHEWLGKMPTRPTHRFIATYKGVVAGVIIMATPNSFSNLLGVEDRHLEKLISRGACISWSPKNLGSALLMFAVRWMVQHTGFRFFTAYSDVEARELGTIYQACNFTYLGQMSGAREEYFDPENPEKGWFSDRQFRKSSQIRRYARELRICWRAEWSRTDKICWEKIPSAVTNLIKDHAQRHRARCISRPLMFKHKYLYILGRSQKETKHLKSIFHERNPDLGDLPYPKFRGPLSPIPIVTLTENVSNTAANPLPPDAQNARPAAREYLTVKEAAEMLRVSEWTIYHLMKIDPDFPSLNIGLKKKFVIDRAKLSDWMKNRTRKLQLRRRRLLTGEELLAKKGMKHA